MCGSTSYALNVDDVKMTYLRAMQAFHKGDYNRAIDLFEDTIELYPNIAQCYDYLGQAHKEVGTKLEEIVWLYEKAIEIDPNHIIKKQAIDHDEHEWYLNYFKK